MTESNTEVEKVDAIYVADHSDARPFVSVLFGPNNRATVLGQFANGDPVRVPVADVIARPAVFRAPCGKAYIVQGAHLINPCSDAVPAPEAPGQVESLGSPVDLQESRRTMAEMFGSDAAYDKLEEAGYFSPDAVRALDEESLAGIVGKGAMRNYQRYLRQAESVLEAASDSASDADA